MVFAYPPMESGTRVRWEARDGRGSTGQQGRRVGPDAPTSRAPRTVYGKLTNRSRKSVAFAASRSIGVVTLKISCIVRSVELWS